MATVTGKTAAAMDAVRDDMVISGHIDETGHLILTRYDGTQIDAGTATGAIDPDITVIAGLSPANNDLIQRKAGAWTNRTLAQLKADLTIINDVKNFGAVGNGIVDDTAAIQAAANSLGSSGGTVYLPPGDFLLNGSNPINLNAPINFQGAGHGATKIRIGSSFTGSSAITVSSDDCMIQGLQIRGDSTTTTSNPACHGVTATGVQEFRVFNATFQWINGYAIRTFGTAANTLHGTQINTIKIQSCAGGIHVKSDVADKAANVQLSNIFTRYLGVNSGANANLDGIRIEDSWDVLCQNVMPWMQATLGGTGTSFRVIGDCAAIFVQNLDALGPQTGSANVVIETGTNGSPQNVQIQGGVIQQGIIGILIAGASNQVRVRNVRILNNQTHNVSVTSTGFGIYFDECSISQAGQGAAGTNYDINWTGSAEGFITDCRFGSSVVAIGSAGAQGIINIASGTVVRVINANFTGSGSTSSNWYPGIQPQMATRVDGTNYETFGNVDHRFSSGQRVSWRPSSSANHVAAINVAGSDTNDRYRIYSDRVEYGPGPTARDTTWGRQGTAQIGTQDSDVVIGLIGKGLRVATGTNAKMGTATLVGGSVTVSNTSVTASSHIIAYHMTAAGTPGWLRVSKVAGTSLTITSSSSSDTSLVGYRIVEPA
jgi:hypothetical protein